MLCLQIYHGLPLKEHLPKTQEKLEWGCLEHRCERSLKLCNWSSIQVLFLFTREAGIVNVQDWGIHWYLSWLASLTKYTDKEPGTTSNPFESLQKFQGRSAFWFISTDELKIKYFLKIYFSQTLMFTGFFIY